MRPVMAPSEVAPLAISGNGRSFLDKTGKPFFWLGDTLWHLFRSYTLEEVRTILEDRKAKGFSVVLVMLFGPEPDPVPNVNGDLPWHDGDPSRLNEKYFAHVDAAMQIACELDFVQVLGVYHKTQDRFYNLERARELARWVADRYREVPQLIWSMYPEAKLRYAPVVREIVKGLAEGDGGAHWATVHPDPSPQSSSFLHQEPWLPFNMLQTCIDIEQILPMVAADYAQTPVKPVVMAEGGYEGVEFDRLITPLDIRRQAYWSYLAGGHHVSGHNDNWANPRRWREWLFAPGSGYLRVYRDIITSLPNWWSLVPDQSIFSRGANPSDVLNAAGHAAAADWALVYLHQPGTTSVRMDRVKTSETIAASWIDPRDGCRERIGRFGYADVKEFTTPAEWEDALLLLEAE